MGQYFVQLEDDIQATEDYLKRMKQFIQANQNKKWSVLEFGSRGFIGMTYRGEHLESLAKFVRLLYWTMPVDWLFRQYNNIYLHQNSRKFVIKPSVFKHVGKFSSLIGQVRSIEGGFKSRDASKNSHIRARRRYQRGQNPAASISTSIQSHHGLNNIQNPYSNRREVFWGKGLRENDAITIEFTKEAQKIQQIVVASGGLRYPNDRFYGAKLLMSKSKIQHENKTNNRDAEQCDDYKMLGSYDGSLIDHISQEPMEGVWCLKVVLTKLIRRRWLMVEEIAVLSPSKWFNWDSCYYYYYYYYFLQIHRQTLAFYRSFLQKFNFFYFSKQDRFVSWKR